MQTFDFTHGETQLLIDIVDRFLVEHSVGIKRPEFSQLPQHVQREVHDRIALAAQLRGKLPALVP